jgi:formiminoglutamase
MNTVNLYICSMPDISNIADFLVPVNLSEISQDEEYHDGQAGKEIEIYTNEYADLTQSDIVLVGCPEQRGAGPGKKSSSPDVVRREFYKLYNWHNSLKLADAGNIRTGASLNDTYAALKTVIKEIRSSGKTAIIIGSAAPTI